jgi:hypothetical protein
MLFLILAFVIYFVYQYDKIARNNRRQSPYK